MDVNKHDKAKQIHEDENKQVIYGEAPERVIGNLGK